MIGATDDDLASIKMPTCIIPGNDRTHAHKTGEIAHRLIPNSELHDLWPGDLDIDLFPAEDWARREPEQARIFTDFLKRNPYFRIAASRTAAFAHAQAIF